MLHRGYAKETLRRPPPRPGRPPDHRESPRRSAAGRGNQTARGGLGTTPQPLELAHGLAGVEANDLRQRQKLNNINTPATADLESHDCVCTAAGHLPMALAAGRRAPGHAHGWGLLMRAVPITRAFRAYAARSSVSGCCVDCRNACASSRHFIARSSSTSRRLGSTVLGAARIQSSAWSS
jgi:hypothetical protein